MCCLFTSKPDAGVCFRANCFVQFCVVVYRRIEKLNIGENREEILNTLYFIILFYYVCIELRNVTYVGYL